MTEQRFDEYAGTYDATVQRAIGASGETVQYFADLKATLMDRLLGSERPKTILDFGCGIGNTSRTLARMFPTADITAVDVSPASIDAARRMSTSSTKAIRYVLAKNGRVPLDDASVEAAFTSCVFHHIEPSERAAWARELRRVLKPGAPLFLFEHNPNNPLTRRVVSQIPFDEGVVLLRARDAVTLLQAEGFVTSRPWFYFFFPRFLRALRPLEPALRDLPLGAQYVVVGRTPRGPALQ